MSVPSVCTTAREAVTTHAVGTAALALKDTGCSCSEAHVKVSIHRRLLNLVLEFCSTEVLHSNHS